MPLIPDISCYQVNKTVVDVDLDGVVIPGLTGEFFWREEGGRMATAGRYSYVGVRLFISWGYRGEAHCAWTSYFVGDRWTPPQAGCPRIIHEPGALLIDGRFRLAVIPRQPLGLNASRSIPTAPQSTASL